MTIDPRLPGANLVTKGLDDARAGRRTVEALLVELAAPRQSPGQEEHGIPV